MGILESAAFRDLSGDRARRRVLRANINALASRRNISYREAVELFGEKIDRSPPTIYSWLVEHEDGSNGDRPLPRRHYETMVDAGLIDPQLTEDEEPA